MKFKSKMINKFLTASVLLGIAGGLSVPVEASVTKTQSLPSGVNFSSPWEYTTDIYYVNTNALTGELCYGYNTTAINEDYVWTRNWFYKHKSKIKNAKGTFESAEKKASTGTGWAKIEVHHKGNSGQKYSIVMTNTPSKDSASDFSKKNTRKTNNKKK